jgi:hypothetical protein
MLPAASKQRSCNDQQTDHSQNEQRSNQQHDNEDAHDVSFSRQPSRQFTGPQIKKSSNSGGMM